MFLSCSSIVFRFLCITSRVRAVKDVGSSRDGISLRLFLGSLSGSFTFGLL
jgi:hypothetical protein